MRLSLHLFPSSLEGEGKAAFASFPYLLFLISFYLLSNTLLYRENDIPSIRFPKRHRVTIMVSGHSNVDVLIVGAGPAG